MDSSDSTKEKKQTMVVKNSGSIKRLNAGWVIKITLSAFVLSMLMSVASQIALEGVHLLFAVFVLVLIISIGIVFDVMGIAVTTAEERPFHSMAAKRVKGSLEAIKLIRNAEKVSSFCNDVVGDIAGIISGSTVAVVVVFFQTGISTYDFLIALVLTGLVSAMTIGGKAVGKTISMNNSNSIVYMAGYVISFFSGIKNILKKKR